MRLEKSARNLFVAWSGQAVYVVVNYITRMVFVRTLAVEYLGIEALFSSILTVLSLAELGIGSAIVYSLYAPLARRDEPQIAALMALYRKAYWIIGTTVAVLGILISFNLNLFIKNPPNIPYLNIIFLMFVANSAVSYFYSYKGSLIAADQSRYIVALYQYGAQILMSVAQIVVLLLTHNYYLFLMCMIASSFFQNFALSIKADKMYPFLKTIQPPAIHTETLSEIKKNTFALMLHKLAGASATPVSNIIMSNFIGLAVVGIYSNYLLVVTALTRIMDQAFDAILASVGNLAVEETVERQIKVFYDTLYINALIYTVVCGGLIASFNTFIGASFGDSFVFDFTVMALIVVLFYVKGMRSAALSFTSAYGLYWFTRYKAILESIVLITLSLILVQVWGIKGVLLSNILSSTFISLIYEGYMLYRHGFKTSSKIYFLRQAVYWLLGFAIIAIVYGISTFVALTGFVGFVVKGALGIICATILFILVTMKTEQFAHVKDMGIRLAGVVKRRMGGRKAQQG